MIARAGIAPEDVVVIKKTYPMVVLRYKGKIGASTNLIMGAAYYKTARHSTVLPFQQIKKTDMEIRTRRMVRMTKKDG